MILRDVLIENWRCIRRLELTDLPDGLVVLHGPNRTGKSSLVLALRACLFDADHDAASKEIKTSIPRNGTGPPKVAVTFTTGGASYRLTKIFSKKKDGTALLEKQIGSLWQPQEKAPKEASRRARELLGAEKSTAGLNQLLWLTQGEIDLPEAQAIDGSLHQKLVHVLGVMMTERDLQFKRDLDKRWETWFTQTGKIKEQSTLNQLEKRRVEVLARRDTERKNWEKLEDALRRLHAGEDELPSRKRAAQCARAELDGVVEERQHCAERLRRHDAAVSGVKAAGVTLAQAKGALAGLRDAQDRMREAERAGATAQDRLNQAQQLFEERVRARDEQSGQLEQARTTEEQHAQDRDAIDDCRKLLALAEQSIQIKDSLKAIASQEEQIAALEQSLKTLKAPDQVALKNLRGNRRQAANLSAQLQAGALTLTVTMRQPTPLRWSVDGQPVRTVHVIPEQPVVTSVRQRAEIAIVDMGTIEVARAHADQDLERTAHQLAQLEQDFQEQVRALQEEPGDEACLDRLLQKQVLQETQSRQLTECRSALHKLAPDGRGALESKIGTLMEQERMLRARRPELAAWRPCAADVSEREERFKARGRELELCRKSLENAARFAHEGYARAADELETHKRNLAATSAMTQAARAEVDRIGDETALLAAVARAAQELAQAEQTLIASQLTEDEQNLDQRFAQAKAADAERDKRLRELENQINEQRGFLQGNEGLHARLMDAEALLVDIEAKLAQQTLEADAHQRLRVLFDECQESQVQQVIGPVAGRVLEWAHLTGLRDFEQVCFGDHFLPEGIVMAGSNPAEPVIFDHESYGTAEQLSLLVRLALGGVLAKDEPGVAILDDPLAHADPGKHRNILNILRIASEGGASWNPPAGRLQIIVLTCHPDRFDHLPGAAHISLEQLIER